MREVPLYLELQILKELREVEMSIVEVQRLLQCFGLRVECLGFRVSGFGFRV